MVRLEYLLNHTQRGLSNSIVNAKEQAALKQVQHSSEPHCIYDMCAIRPGTPQPCVVIVGAGMAGLSAAARLVQCGITNFKILEAMDGPGGRMRSCWIGDGVAETGWSLIEGASLANTIYILAAQERLLSVPLKRTDHEIALVVTPDGRPLDHHTTSKGVSIFGEMESAAEEPTDSYPVPKSLGERLECLLREKVERLPKIERWDTARAVYGLMAGLRSTLGQSLYELSPNALAERTILPGGNVRVKGGMAGLVAPLIRELPPGAIVYCKPVHCILWGTAGPGAPRAVVKCCDGENVPADYVLVTVPLGVLKNMGDRLFCPQLPAFKMEAVRGLGFSTVNKIFLKYDRPFWAGLDGEVILAWSPKDFAEEKSWTKGISGIEIQPGSSKVLSISVSGAEAKKMEALTDTQVAADVQNLLKRFLRLTAMPSPTEILRSSWSENSYFSGSRTVLNLGSGRGMIKSLSKPLPCDCDTIPPIILFAGEHTHPKYFGTLHGSRLSGIREADRIVEMTKRFNGPPNKGPACIPCN